MWLRSEHPPSMQEAWVPSWHQKKVSEENLNVAAPSGQLPLLANIFVSVLQRADSTPNPAPQEALYMNLGSGCFLTSWLRSLSVSPGLSVSALLRIPGKVTVGTAGSASRGSLTLGAPGRGTAGDRRSEEHEVRVFISLGLCPSWAISVAVSF